MTALDLILGAVGAACTALVFFYIGAACRYAFRKKPPAETGSVLNVCCWRKNK